MSQKRMELENHGGLRNTLIVLGWDNMLEKYPTSQTEKGLLQLQNWRKQSFSEQEAEGCL